jgi:hypothetical protein
MNSSFLDALTVFLAPFGYQGEFLVNPHTGVFFAQRLHSALGPSILLLPIPPQDPYWTPQSWQAAIAYPSRQILIWEDTWLEKPQALYSRLQSVLGNTQRIHARQTQVRRISNPVLQDFLLAHHTAIPLGAKFKYGLFHKEALVAVAAFGPLLTKTAEGHKKSGELIRFCNLSGTTVVGGLDKLLQAFIKEKSPNDLMTYAERDWSDGESYARLGFIQQSVLPPQAFWVKAGEKKRHYAHHLLRQMDVNITLNDDERQGFLKQQGYFSVFNAGSLKFIKEIS